METYFEFDMNKVKGLAEDYRTVGRKEEYANYERLGAIIEQYRQIYKEHRKRVSIELAHYMAVQALLDAGYRAGKRAERARRKAAA